MTVGRVVLFVLLCPLLGCVVVTGTNSILPGTGSAGTGSGVGPVAGRVWYSGSETGIGTAVGLFWNIVKHGFNILKILSNPCIVVTRNKINPQIEPALRIRVKAMDSKVGNSGGIMLLMSKRGPVVPIFIPHWV